MQHLAEFSWIDIGILSIMLAAIIIGFSRGAVKTSISIISWAIAVYIAIYYSHNFADYLKSIISNTEVRLWVTRIGVFIVVMVIGNIIGAIMNYMLIGSGLKGTDRLLGFVLGAILGVFVVASLILLAGYTNFVKSDLFTQSQFIPYFMDLAVWIKSTLPVSLTDFIDLIPTDITPPPPANPVILTPSSSVTSPI